MNKIFKPRSKREKFKAMERKINKGRWYFILVFGVLWFGIGTTITISLLDYLAAPGPTTQRITMTWAFQSAAGILVGFFLWEQLKKDYKNQKRSMKMGAWGMGVFDDDSSCDVIETCIDEDQSIELLINQALSTLNSDCIEYTECHEVIVACAMYNALVNGESYKEIDDLDEWLAKQRVETAVPHKRNLITALQQVLTDKSELNELWEENKEDYSTWRNNIEELVSALEKSSEFNFLELKKPLHDA